MVHNKVLLFYYLVTGAIELIIVVPQPVTVLHLKECLSVCNAELGDHRTCSENCPAHLNIVAVGPLKDPPVLEATIKCLVTRPPPPTASPDFFLGCSCCWGT